MVVHWLKLYASYAGGIGSILGGGIKIPHAVWHGQKKKKKKNHTENRINLLLVTILPLFPYYR